MKPQTALVGLNEWNRSSTIQPPNPLTWFGQQFGSKLRRVLRSVPPFMIPLRINNRLPHRYLDTMEVEPLPTPKLKSTDPYNSNNVVDHHSHAQPRNGFGLAAPPESGHLFLPGSDSGALYSSTTAAQWRIVQQHRLSCVHRDTRARKRRNRGCFCCRGESSLCRMWSLPEVF